MLLRCLRAELIKCRRNPVWLAFLILPLFPAILGTLNYLGNLAVLQNGWYSLWTQHTLFAAYFFLPAQLAVFCAWQWRLEHSGHSWNQWMTAPVPVRDLLFAKLLVSAGISVLAQVCIGVLFLLGGLLAGLPQPVPAELWGWIGFGTLGGIAVCAAQCFFSMVIHSFAVPVGIGLLGGILGMQFTVRGLGYAFPYSLLALGMRSNNPNLELRTPPFFLSCGIYIAVFFLLSLCILHRNDVRSE